MIRVVVFLVVVACLALVVGWFADNPGGVDIIWLGQHITTKVSVLVAAMMAVLLLAMFCWWLLSLVLRSPGRLTHHWRTRRAARGQRAITRGFIAVGAGDLRAAQKHAAEAKRLAHHEPLTLLLAAQAAQLVGDRSGAEDAFRSMMERDELKAIGLHGLFVEARTRNDVATARNLAEEAVRTAPSLAWAGHATLEFRCTSADWGGALDALERNMISGLIDKLTYRRQRAVLLTARAQALAESDRDAAKALAVEAAKLAPGLVPAAALAGQFHADAGDRRRASRVLESAWRASPHPDIAEAYIHLRPGDSARERLVRAQKLAKLAIGHVEGALALARAAIDAHVFAVARAALEPFIAAPTRRLAMLMAELEEAESGDVGRARAWTARAVHAAHDPAWTADGFVSESWVPVSPATGRLDAFEWKAPVAALPGTVIEADDRAPLLPARPGNGADRPSDPVPLADDMPPRRDDSRRETLSAALPATRRATAPPASRVESVIPLVHAPDDPGPEHAEEPEIQSNQPADGRPRLRDLFK